MSFMRLLSTLLAAVLATTAFSALAAEAKDPVEARKAIFKAMDMRRRLPICDGQKSACSVIFAAG
jgi:cytochrome c556